MAWASAIEIAVKDFVSIEGAPELDNILPETFPDNPIGFTSNSVENMVLAAK